MYLKNWGSVNSTNPYTFTAAIVITEILHKTFRATIVHHCNLAQYLASSTSHPK